MKFFNLVIFFSFVVLKIFSQPILNTEKYDNYFSISNENLLRVNIKNKKSSFDLGHSFFIEKFKFQVFDLSLSYPILNKNKIKTNFKSSLFGNYLFSTPRFYLTPQFSYFHKKVVFKTSYNFNFSDNNDNLPNLYIEAKIQEKLNLNFSYSDDYFSLHNANINKRIFLFLFFKANDLNVSSGFSIPSDLDFNLARFHLICLINARFLKNIFKD